MPPGRRRAPSAVLAIAFAAALAGCSKQSGSHLRYAQVLDAPPVPADVSSKLERPDAHCLEQAKHFVRRDSDILREPIDSELREGYEGVLRGLHPTAKQVLRSTHGVWLARDIPGAAARFIPCEGAEGQMSGLVLLDVDAYPLDENVRDDEVPRLYWRLLGIESEEEPDDELDGHDESEPVRTAGGERDAAPTAHTSTPSSGPARAAESAAGPGAEAAVRYVLLHELGHALSLLAGEFVLDSSRSFRPGASPGFLSFSWREHPSLDATSGAYVPMGLAFNDWRVVRRALHAEPTVLAPGYRRSPLADRLSAHRCGMASKLPAAGFVTPAAAVSPTEDFAELFAHAILAAEGKVQRSDHLEVDGPGCTFLGSPYFSRGVSAKRHYIEGALRLQSTD